MLTGSLAPAAGVVLFIIALASVLAVRGLRARRTCPLPRCPQCRYVAAGLMGTRCPECGHDHDRGGVLPARTPRPWPLWITIGLWLLVAGAVWVSIIEPAAVRLSLSRDISDSLRLTQPHSGAYDSVQLQTQSLEWPIDLIEPRGTWTLTLRSKSGETFTLTFRSDDETITVESVAAWMAQVTALDEITTELDAEARVILDHAQQPGDRRGVIRFGVATRRSRGPPGPSRPFGEIQRRISLQPVRHAWLWHAALLGMILLASIGVGGLVLRERRRRRRCIAAWAAIRPTPTDRPSLPTHCGDRTADFL